jgi:hypothetical protein
MMVSSAFGKRAIQRHQQVYATLGDKMKTDEFTLMKTLRRPSGLTWPGQSFTTRPISPHWWCAERTMDDEITDFKADASTVKCRSLRRQKCSLRNCACLLTAEPVTLLGMAPRLQDVSYMLTLIRNMVGGSMGRWPGGC